jgi:hypothetical protein
VAPLRTLRAEGWDQGVPPSVIETRAVPDTALIPHQALTHLVRTARQTLFFLPGYALVLSSFFDVATSRVSCPLRADTCMRYPLSCLLLLAGPVATSPWLN